MVEYEVRGVSVLSLPIVVDDRGEMDVAGDASVQLSDVNCWIVVRRLQGLFDYLEVCTAHFLRVAPLRWAKVDQPRNKVEDRRCVFDRCPANFQHAGDRKSTRLNSSH